MNQQNIIPNKEDEANKNRQFLTDNFKAVKVWINSMPGLKFFSPLSLSVPVKFLELEKMEGLFGADGLVVTSSNEVIIGIDFMIDLSKLQMAYFFLNSLLQIAHLHSFRLLPIIESKTLFSGIDESTRAACAGIAAMCYTNDELNDHLSDYFDVLSGCEHIIANVSLENYWKHLGWEKIEDVPDPIKDVKSMLHTESVHQKTTVERLAILFIRYHNPNNPPKMPTPLWARSGDGKSVPMDPDKLKAYESQAKHLVRASINAAKEEEKLREKSAGNCFCPFELDDLHAIESKAINYKDLLQKMVVDASNDFGGYDKRNLGTGIDVDYNYSMESEQLSCVIYVDTSYSLIDSIHDILSEVKTIVTSFPYAKVLVKYFAGDVQKDDEERYITPDTPIEDWTLPETTGGTSYGPIREDIEDNYPSANIIIITDGFFCDEVTSIYNSGQRMLVATQSYNDSVDWDLFGVVAFSDIED